MNKHCFLYFEYNASCSVLSAPVAGCWLVAATWPAHDVCGCTTQERDGTGQAYFCGSGQEWKSPPVSPSNLHVCVTQSEHLAPLCFPTLAQTRESVDYWMQLQCAGQTIKIDSAFVFYHTPNIPEVKACEPWATGILIMIENMPPEWGGILLKKYRNT